MYSEEKLFLEIEGVIKDVCKYHAHTNKSEGEIDNKNETLKEHTELCVKYFKKLIKTKKLESIFLNLENEILCDASDADKKIFRELLVNLIVFHDFGKINPRFQREVMDNKVEGGAAFSAIGSQHSILSSVIYMDYFMNKVMNADDSIKLVKVLLINAHIISKHHSGLDDFNKFINLFAEDESGKYCIDILKSNYANVGLKSFEIDKDLIQEAIEGIKVNEIYSENESLACYTYERLMYSLLVACDFYATSEYMNGFELNEFGDIKEIDEIYNVYKETELYKLIRDYETNKYAISKTFECEKDINVLRTEMFLDAERELVKNYNENIYFLEAPTGSGKSNVSMNLSFKLLEDNSTLLKIFYIYPFNTLIEQNIEVLSKTFGKNSDVLKKIAVVNSISPIKLDKEKMSGSDDECDDFEYYSKALLNRQFLNYPMVLSTHVTLFNTMFNSSREALFSFHQLVNSVVVLDEIQSYKNTIWTEIITFLKKFAKLLNMKIIIMSATLPNLNALTGKGEDTIHLIKNRVKYFENNLFKNRVQVNYDLVSCDNQREMLYKHVKGKSTTGKSILLEFIKKESAYSFYRELKEDSEIDCEVLLMTGDDNSIERTRILDIVKETNKKKEEEKLYKSVILVATQVIEAGVDIDMEIGYKDLSKLDSDEQFLGRINRSCKNHGEVYFFNLDDAKVIYKNDVRINLELTLISEEMKEILSNKDFNRYYEPVLDLIKTEINGAINSNNLNDFFKEKVGGLYLKDIENRMKLIDEDSWSMSIYLCSCITDKEGEIINGELVWEDYKNLLNDNKMDYPVKQVKLSYLRSKMNYFIYQIKKTDDLIYNDRIGELYCIYDGEKYFKDNKLDKEQFQTHIGEVI
ncbi:MAG: CRISPR-associated helicase Cas3' [Clostridium sp.]